MRRRVSCAVTATPDSTTPAQTLVQTVGRLETRPRRKATDQFIDPAALPLIALVRSTQEVTKESQKACCVLFHDFSFSPPFAACRSSNTWRRIRSFTSVAAIEPDGNKPASELISTAPSAASSGGPAGEPFTSDASR